jgi:hypothetical protein
MSDTVWSDTEWGDSARAVLDETIERDESLRLRAEDLDVSVPLTLGEDSPRARWVFDGTVTVTVEGMRGSLAEWAALYERDRRSPTENVAERENGDRGDD